MTIAKKEEFTLGRIIQLYENLQSLCLSSLTIVLVFLISNCEVQTYQKAKSKMKKTKNSTEETKNSMNDDG